MSAATATCPLAAQWPNHAPAVLEGCTCPDPGRAATLAQLRQQDGEPGDGGCE